ncbi:MULTISPECIES: DsbA family protein [Helicobacter]|uniref:Thiol:disulfide interchange protein DsbA n=1 Tax=Helicobacter ibis TaxID=2962633 RepID=A0ABT4VEU8_9HELI|nr:MULTISPECIES: DsbA family protein [Helicobacter]MDA3967093.1 DsbA family protein [Helicobacter sp. WB40]MDA3969223.1 DsbA family protein [Helicobacter ibis]
MKLFKVLFLGILSFGVLFAGDLKEGEDYIILKNPIKNTENSVIELFNVGCPHCEYFNKDLPKVLEFLPNSVAFYPYHLSAGVRLHEVFSEILAVALNLDLDTGLSTKSNNSNFKKVTNLYFDLMHTKQKKWQSEDEFLSDGLAILGISSEEYKKILKDKNTQNTLKKWRDSMQYAEFQGVPSFIVNGKYMIVTKNISSTEDLIFKIDSLLEKK